MALRAHLLDDVCDAAKRRAAVDTLGSEGGELAADLYALRAALLSDKDASVRAAAASRLGELAKRYAANAGHGTHALVLRAVPAWLIDATTDSHLSVRDAAYRALVQVPGHLACRDPGCLPHVQRAILFEPVWSVRRSAVVCLAALVAGEDMDVAASALAPALDDPFWRVRHAAISALLMLASRDVRERTPAVDALRLKTDAGRAALAYVRRALAGHTEPAGDPAPRPEPPQRADGSLDPLWDPDPAVMTARIERSAGPLSPAVLIYVLGDSHEPLRRAAIKRLFASGDMRAYRAALAWLDDPRVPYAKEACASLLEALAARRSDTGNEAAALAASVLDEAAGGVEIGPGALAWALSQAAAMELGGPGALRDRREDGLMWMRSRHRDVRISAALALASAVSDDQAAPALGEAAASALAALAQDQDPDVAHAAACGLAASRPRPSRHDRGEDRDRGYVALRALPYHRLATRVRRMAVAAARARGDHAYLAQAASDPDSFCQSQALAGLAAAGLIDDSRRDAAQRDPDPWVRATVLDEGGALAALGLGPSGGGDVDPDPWLRRQAVAVLEGGGGRRLPWPVRVQVGLACSRMADDPGMRARGASLLAPRRGELAPSAPSSPWLSTLLMLSADSVLMVRAAAADGLSACPDLDGRLSTLLAEDGHADEVRKAAYTWLCRRLHSAASARIAAALDGTEPPAVAEHLRAMQLAFAGTSALAGAPFASVTAAPSASRLSASTQAPHNSANASRSTSRSALGRSGIEVSPLGISGAFELPANALIHALDSGVNLFFWEPRYEAMTRFLRADTARRQRLLVAAGSYHADPAAIRADVKSALRRLRCDSLDVFLLFWARSPARLGQEAWATMSSLKQAGLIRLAGFSTHDRALAVQALTAHPWDVVMTRHSAAHPGAEDDLLPLAAQRGVGVLGFSALSYGRLLRPTSISRPVGDSDAKHQRFAPSAADCYRYSLSQPGVSACISAPRRFGELLENLEVLRSPTLDPEAAAILRAHGLRVRERSRDFNALVRREPGASYAELIERVGELLDIAPPLHF